MRGGAAAVEESGGGEQQGAGAHRGRPGAGGVGGAQPAEEGLVLHLVALAGAAGDDHDVRGGHLGEGPVGDEREAALVVADRAGLLGDEDGLGAGAAAEDLVRADGVEGGEAVEEHDGDLHGGPFQWVGAECRAEAAAVLGGAVPRALTKARRMASGVP